MLRNQRDSSVVCGLRHDTVDDVGSVASQALRILSLRSDRSWWMMLARGHHAQVLLRGLASWKNAFRVMTRPP